ncbi:hypothetical protein FRC04_003460 [Tulasnella sp. 424]|nr:hypothetical protein FRC04_003460 [Tulasnella sp. 424]
MVHSFFKSLFLFSTLAASVVLAAPAQLHQPVDRRAVVAGDVSRREDLPLSYPWVGGSTASTPVEKRSEGVKKAIGPKRVTNAMRIANGLPPLAPRKLCYVSKGFNDWNSYFVTADCTAAMINPKYDSGALTNPNGAVAMMGGTAAKALTSRLIALSVVLAKLAPTGSDPEALVQDDMMGGSVTYFESNVWSLGTNNELIPTWVNGDGKAAHTELGYLPGYGIAIAGSISNIGASLPGTVQIVSEKGEIM